MVCLSEVYIPKCNFTMSLQGEPHLSSGYAVMMSYWEGIVHFVLFLTIISRMFKGWAAASQPVRHVFIQKSSQSNPFYSLSTQEVLSQPGAAVGRLLDRTSDCSHPRGGHRWELPTWTQGFIGSPEGFYCVADGRLYVQVNTGPTFDQPFGGTSRSSWCLSGLRPCSSAGWERCQSSQQTRSASWVFSP